MVAKVAELRPGDEEVRKEHALLWEANTYLQQELAEEKRRVSELEREIIFLRTKHIYHIHEEAWHDQVGRVDSSTISASQKATARGLRALLREIKPNADGFCHVEAWQITRFENMGESTHLSNIQYLSDEYVDGELTREAKLPLFEKRLVTIIEPGEKKRGRPQYRVFLKALPLLEQPNYWQDAVTTPRNHGGADRNQGRRKKCECGGDIVERDHSIVKQKVGECNRCHTVAWAEEPRPVHAAWLPTDPAPSERLKNQLDFNSDSAEEAEISKQLDAVPLYKTSPQVDCKSDEQEPEGLKNQLDFKSPEGNPSMSPMPLDASQMEAAACDLLLEIAGSGPEHIEMNTNPELTRKYTTIHRALHKGDMLAHLHGVRTKGATLRHPFGLTRAYCFEADNPQDWQRDKESALLLAEAGFKPMLEPSPAREGHVGGGHLWIVFDKLVDAYDAYQTVIALAPMLAQGKEYWPNGGSRVRLPGGKYVTPGYEAWCHLTDAYGNELSHDGAGAASVLLEMQTPAALVKKHEKKTELVLTQEAITKPTPHAGGILGEKADVLDDVLRDFEYSWDDLAGMAGGYNEDGYFSAKWRGDGRNPNVKVWWEKDRATDFSSKAWPDCRYMDRHHVWCLLQAGENWREFRRLDLDQRCRAYRAERQEVHA